MSKRSQKAEKKYRRDAEKGDPIAQFNLGHAYFLDGEETRDYSEVFQRGQTPLIFNRV